MRYTDIRASVKSLFAATNKTPIYLEGAPGLGKTSIAFDVATDLGIPAEAVFIFRPSLHDPVDLMGVPHVEDKVTHWASPSFLMNVNAAAEKFGKALLVWDEMPQSVVMMQNAIAGLLLDREVGEFKLHPGVFQMATGNRTKDKAGANRVVSQLANRVMRLEMEPHLDDWCEWALDNGRDITLISFMRFRPGLLCDFNPDNFSNPTPRAWDKVSEVPTSLPDHIYHGMLSGLVGEGPAAEYIGFRRIADALPNIDVCLLDPKGCSMPEDPAALYAFTGALAAKASKDNFDSITTLADRMPPEFSVLVIKDSIRMTPGVSNTKAFTQWAVKNKNVLI